MPYTPDEFSIFLSVPEIGVLYAIIQNIEANTTQRKDMAYMAVLRSIKEKLERMMNDYVEKTKNEASGYRSDNCSDAYTSDSLAR